MSHNNVNRKNYEMQIQRNFVYNNIDRVLNCNQVKYPISQDSLVDGVYKITKPGYYYLTQDIVFDVPMDIQKYVFEKAEESQHIFGNHSGIIIESDYVILDLCGYSISQSARFYAVQRFFNLIQLNNFPFILNENKPCVHAKPHHGCPVVGPMPNVLIEEFRVPKFIVIRNGNFGLTSHTCIHGNNNKYVVLENLQASNFEVSMITLNKVENLVACDLTMHNSLSVVPFTPFLVTISLAIKSFLSVGLTLDDVKVLHDNLKPLIMEIDKAKTIEELVKIAEHYPEYDNKINNYLSPCGQFGISITRKGPSVHSFSENLPSDEASSKCIFLHKINIKNMHVNVFEDISIGKNKKPVELIAGSVMRTVKMEHPLCLEILKILKSIDSETRKTISGLDDKMIDNVLSPSKEHPLELCRGIDNMAHVSKGIVCIRLDDCVHCSVVDVNINDISNKGKPLSEEEIKSTMAKYHSDSITMMNSTLFSPNSYVGNNSCGVLISSGKYITNLHNTIDDVKSTHGCAIGIGLNNKVNTAFLENIVLKNIDSNNNKNDSGTLLIDEDCEDITLSRIYYN